MHVIARIIGGLILLAILVVGGAVAYWLTTDASVWKGEISSLASQQLGRDLTIAGQIKPTFSLTDGFGLRVTSVTLANAPGFQPANMVSINTLELVVDILAILDNKLHVKKFLLQDADVTLEARGDINNWTFKEQPKQVADAKDATPSQRPEISADEIAIRNLTLSHINNGMRKQYVVKELDVTAATGEPVTIKLTATADGQDVVLDVTAGTLDAIESGQKQRLTGDIAYGPHQAKIAADYRRNDSEHNFNNLSIDYNGMQANGNMGLNLAGNVPYIMADLVVPVIDFATLTGGAAGAGSGTAAATGQADAPLFSREPLPWDALKSANASVALDIKQLKSADKSYGPANIQARLNNGLLNATVITQPPGATKPVTIRTRANAARTMQLTVDAPGLDASTLSHWLGQDEPLVQAPARFAMDITGQGNSLHDVMGGANGGLQLDFAPGKLNVGAMPTALSAVLGSMVGPEKLANASIACLKADFGIENGIAKSRGLGTAASVLNASGEGLVNLRDETVNLGLVVDARETVKQLPLVPVGITGNLKKPVVAADMKALRGQIINSVVDNVAGKTIVGQLGGIAQGLTGSKMQQVKKPFNPCRPNEKPEPEAAPQAPAVPAQQPTTPQEFLKNPEAAKELLKNPGQLLNLFGGQKQQQ